LLCQEKEEEVQLLETLEDMLHNKIMKRQEEVHKTRHIAENDKLSIEIDRHTPLGNSTESFCKKTVGRTRTMITTAAAGE
jgi:hypothetical protein